MLKQITVLLVAAAAIYPCYATGIQKCFVKSAAPEAVVFKAKPEKQFTPQAKVFRPKQTPRFNVNDDVVMHTVTLKAIYDSEEYENPWSCGIQNKDIAQYPVFDENGVATVELPEGSYCASIMFDPSDEGSLESKITRMIFVEDIVVDSDITVEFAPEMATCLVNFQPLLPNGEVMTLKSYGDYDFAL